MSRIITKTIEETNRELIEDAAKKTAEDIKKILEESNSTAGGSKVSQILRNAGKGSTSQQTDEKKEEKSKSGLDQERERLEDIKRQERQEFDKEKEKLQRDLEESEVYCPTCSGTKHEHKHLLKRTDKGTLKCADGECKIEYALVPKNPDYKCEKCGLPHKKPLEHNENDECPMCGSKVFEKLEKHELKKYKIPTKDEE